MESSGDALEGRSEVVNEHVNETLAQGFRLPALRDICDEDANHDSPVRLNRAECDLHSKSDTVLP